MPSAAWEPPAHQWSLTHRIAAPNTDDDSVCAMAARRMATMNAISPEAETRLGVMTLAANVAFRRARASACQLRHTRRMKRGIRSIRQGEARRGAALGHPTDGLGMA